MRTCRRQELHGKSGESQNSPPIIVPIARHVPLRNLVAGAGSSCSCPVDSSVRVLIYVATPTTSPLSCPLCILSHIHSTAVSGEGQRRRSLDDRYAERVRRMRSTVVPNAANFGRRRHALTFSLLASWPSVCASAPVGDVTRQLLLTEVGLPAYCSTRLAFSYLLLFLLGNRSLLVAVQLGPALTDLAASG